MLMNTYIPLCFGLGLGLDAPLGGPIEPCESGLQPWVCQTEGNRTAGDYFNGPGRLVKFLSPVKEVSSKKG